MLYRCSCLWHEQGMCWCSYTYDGHLLASCNGYQLLWLPKRCNDANAMRWKTNKFRCNNLRIKKGMSHSKPVAMVYQLLWLPVDEGQTVEVHLPSNRIVCGQVSVEFKPFGWRKQQRKTGIVASCPTRTVTMTVPVFKHYCMYMLS